MFGYLRGIQYNYSMIYEEKWKYEIPFNNNVYREIKRYSFNLDEDSKNLLDKEIDFYRHNFSLLQIMEAYDKIGFDDREHFIEVVYKRLDGLLYCPKFLKQYFIDLINSKYRENSEFFIHLLTVATTKKAKNVPLKLYKLILGKYYGKVKKMIMRYASRHYSYEPKPKILDSKKFCQKLHSTLSTDRITQGIWGEIDDTIINFYVDNSEGFGRLKSNHFTAVSRDSYTIHEHGNNIEYSFYRNIYPGEAHFYNNVLPYHSRNIDLGSDWLINGWSFFACTHVKKSIHTKNVHSVMGNIMRPILSFSDYGKGLETAYLYMLTKMPKKLAFDTILTITQKVGLYESYVLGGLATELIIDHGFAASPMDLLRRYRRENLGDFFALYR